MGAAIFIAGDARVSHQSFGQRMLNSCCGMLVGLVLFLLALALTGFNEGDYVTRQEVLAKAREAAHPHDCLDTLAGQSAQTLLFLQGCDLNGLPQWDAGPGSGFDLGNVTGAWMRTKVEMYQWHEVEHSETHKDGSGGKTTVTWSTHERRWSTKLEASPTHCDQPSADAACRVKGCDSGRYSYPDSASPRPKLGACNPALLPSRPADGTRYAQQGSVRLGATAQVNSEQMKSLTSSKAVVPTNVASDPTGSVPLPLTKLSPTNTWWDENAQMVLTQPHEGPRVGDVRVSFAVSSATSATALAAVDKRGLMVPWTSGAKARVIGSSTQVDELMEGDVSLESFFDTLDARVAAKVWTLRIFCLLLFCISPYLVLQPIALAPERVPCVGQMIADLVGCAICLASLAIGLSWFLLVTGLCWIWFRPVVGVPLVATALLLVGGLVWHQRKRRGRGRHLPTEFAPMETMPYGQPQGAIPMPYAQPQAAQAVLPYAQPPAAIAVPLVTGQCQVAGQCQPSYIEPCYVEPGGELSSGQCAPACIEPSYVEPGGELSSGQCAPAYIEPGYAEPHVPMGLPVAGS